MDDAFASMRLAPMAAPRHETIIEEMMTLSLDSRADLNDFGGDLVS